MTALNETQSALLEFKATSAMHSGIHGSGQVAIGVRGRRLGDVQYRPGIHSRQAINHFSLMGRVTGNDYVSEVLATHPTEIKVVVDDRQAEEDRNFTIVKHNIAHLLVEDIDESMVDIEDRLGHFVLRQKGDNRPTEPYTEVIEADNDYMEAASSVAQLATSGLVIVISGFKQDLPLHEVTDQPFTNVAAIKVNHKAERGYIPKTRKKGRIALGSTAELNTRQPKQVAMLQGVYEERHQTIVGSLNDIGIPVASVVSDGLNYPRFGFDFDQADRSIAGAIRSLN